MADRKTNPSILSFSPDDFTGDEDPWAYTVPPLMNGKGDRSCVHTIRLDPDMDRFMREAIASRLLPANTYSEFMRTGIWVYVVRFLGGSMARVRVRIREDVRRFRALQDEAARELRESAVESLLEQRCELIRRRQRLDSPDAAGREWLRTQRILSTRLAGAFRDWGLRQLENRGDIAIARDAATRLLAAGYTAPVEEVVTVEES